MKNQCLKWLFLMLPSLAYAHHPNEGEAPQDVMQGLLSGLAHPVIEPDHFLFIIGFSVLLALTCRYIVVAIGMFLTLTIVGTFIRLSFPDLAFNEMGVFITTFLSGALLLHEYMDRFQLSLALAGVAGVVHGYGYGEAVVGAESTALFPYLLGFTLIQGALILGMIFLLRLIASNSLSATQSWYRAIGGAILIALSFAV